MTLTNTRQSTLIKVTPLAPVTQYLADAPANAVTGETHFSNNRVATEGRVAGLVGNGGSIIFNDISVPMAGTYTINFPYFNGAPSRPASISVNDPNSRDHDLSQDRFFPNRRDIHYAAPVADRQ